MVYYGQTRQEEDHTEALFRAPVINQDGSINSHGMHVIAQLPQRPMAGHDDSQLSPLSTAPMSSSLSPTVEHSMQLGQPSFGVRDRHSMPIMTFDESFSFGGAANESQSTFPGSPASPYFSVNGRADSPYPSNIILSAANSPVPFGRNDSSEYGSNDYVTPLDLDPSNSSSSLCVAYPETPGGQASTARAASCPSLYSGPSAEEPGVNGCGASYAPPTPGANMFRNNFLSPYDIRTGDTPSPNPSVTGSRSSGQSGRSGSQSSTGRRPQNDRQRARQDRRAKKNQTKKEKLPCNEEGCNKEFRSTYELRRHVNSFHSNNAKRFICQDPNELAIATSFQVDRPLSGCKDCDSKKEYNAYYNAAAHLRRRHFPAAAQTRAAWAGGDWPPMSELKGRWIVEVQPAEAVRQNPFNADPANMDVTPLFSHEEAVVDANIMGEDFLGQFDTWQSAH